MVSSELPEVLGMSDRVMITHEKEISGVNLVGKYGTMGKINDVARWSGSVTHGDKEFNHMSKVCLDDYRNRN